MILRILLFFLIFISPIFSLGAQKDSLRHSSADSTSFLRKQIVPITLIVGGSLLNIGDLKENIQDKIPDYVTDADDYLQYVPMAQIYLGDILGIKHKNTVFDQTKYLVISQVSSLLITYSIKKITDVERPWEGTGSFPSGHTTKAFVGATVLFHEYKETAPLYAWSGYIFATATGVLRLTKDAHWLPDVLVGAGIAIFMTNLVYHFEPLKNFQPFKKKKDLAFTPVVGPSSAGLYIRF